MCVRSHSPFVIENTKKKKNKKKKGEYEYEYPSQHCIILTRMRRIYVLGGGGGVNHTASWPSSSSPQLTRKAHEGGF